MILILGGTTEGRKAVQALEEAGKPFYYSTKGNEQKVPLRHGIPLTGGMDVEAMTRFCHENGIRLLVDAAHPFAEQLHHTVKQTSDRLSLPVIRFERIYPQTTNKDIVWCKDYEDAIQKIKATVPLNLSKIAPLNPPKGGTFTLLVLTGVQTIARLRPLWQSSDICCYFRILDRESSRAIAAQQGFPAERLCYTAPLDLPQIAPLNPPKGGTYSSQVVSSQVEDYPTDYLTTNSSPFGGVEGAILLKENGTSGGFVEKVEAAARLGIRVFAIRRPMLPDSFLTVNGEHGLRRMVERLLPDFYPLHSGLTTGTCATAAAVAAVYSLFGQTKEEVPVTLPNGESILVPVEQDIYNKGIASVIKDAGDDPDITNGAMICAAVAPLKAPLIPPKGGTSDTHAIISPPFGGIEGGCFVLRAGSGIGTVTLPGLGLPVGSAAINETPRRMIIENVGRALQEVGAPIGTYRVTLSVPEGERLAERTFNPRLGVVGGISIIGTSGIVKPFSSEAFVESIRKYMEVAQATDSPCIVINSGAKSERFLRNRYPELPVQAFVHYGNFIGETLRIAHELRVPRLVMGLMIGKAVKLAEGHLDTHSRHTTMNLDFICRTATEVGCSPATVAAIRHITLARQLWDTLTVEELPHFARRILQLCHQHCQPLFPEGELTILLIAETGKIYEECCEAT